MNSISTIRAVSMISLMDINQFRSVNVGLFVTRVQYWASSYHVNA